jgi:hypothetical protein
MEEPTDPDMFLSLFNIFMQFYKKTYSNDSHKYFFDKISDIADTNKPMELFFECITEYKASSYKEAESYDKDLIIKYESQYILSINDESTFMSDNILSLIIEVAKLEPKIKFDIIELNTN